VTLGVRPEHLVAADQGDAVMEGRVFVVERLGGETYCHVRVDGGQGGEQSVVIRTDGDSAINPGEQIRIGIPAAHCHLFDRDGIALDRVERHPLADQEMPRHAVG